MWSKQPKAKHLERQQQRLAERHNEHLARREDTKGSVQLTRFMTWPLGKELQPVMGSKYYLKNINMFQEREYKKGWKTLKEFLKNTDNMFGKKMMFRRLQELTRQKEDHLRSWRKHREK